MQEEMYAPDKPDDCSLCHFWNSSQSGCSLGRDNCYYLIREAPKVKSEYDGCPYGILLDRMNLSARNGWLDENGRVYIIFTLEETMAALNCGDNKATKLYNELEKKCGLIERKRQGLGKPNLIYVKNFITGMDGSKLIYNTKRRLQHGLQCNRNSNAAYISEKNCGSCSYDSCVFRRKYPQYFYWGYSQNKGKKVYGTGNDIPGTTIIRPASF